MHLVTFEALESARRRTSGALARPADQSGEGLDSAGPGKRRLGALLDSGRPHEPYVVDLNRTLALRLALDDVGAPEAEADSRIPAEMRTYLECGDSELARATLRWLDETLGRFDAPRFALAGALFDSKQVRLHAPVPRPGKLVVVDGNYAGQRRGVDAVTFVAARSSIVGPEDEIQLADEAGTVVPRVTLAVVIGARAHALAAADTRACIAGYCVANDVGPGDDDAPCERGFIGRSRDSFTPLGPALVTADEIRDPQSLALSCTLSGEPWQQATTKEMRLGVDALLSQLSQQMTLEPGDVVLTGTPERVANGERAHRGLRDGDLVVVEIAGLGRLSSYVRAAGRA